MGRIHSSSLNQEVIKHLIKLLHFFLIYKKDKRYCITIYKKNCFLLAALERWSCLFLQEEEGQCIWYGECKDTPSGKINCEYHGPPKVMEDPAGMDILRTYCPDLVTGNSTRRVPAD